METDRELSLLLLDSEGLTGVATDKVGSTATDNDMIGARLVMLCYLVSSTPLSSLRADAHALAC